MKKYKLKRWYPSLDSCWEVEDIAHYYYRDGVYWNGTRVVENGVSAKEVENNPDFWELIEEKPKPLFVTEDGIEITDEMQEVITVDSDVNVDYTRYKWANKTHLIFGSKDGADGYIWKNKRVFSYEDIIEHAYNNPKYRIFIEKLAMERVCNG